VIKIRMRKRSIRRRRKKGEEEEENDFYKEEGKWLCSYLG
jgi:hypothetical protein